MHFYQVDLHQVVMHFDVVGESASGELTHLVRIDQSVMIKYLGPVPQTGGTTDDNTEWFGAQVKLEERRETDKEVPFPSPEARQDLRGPCPSADEKIKAQRDVGQT